MHLRVFGDFCVKVQQGQVSGMFSNNLLGILKSFFFLFNQKEQTGQERRKSENVTVLTA